MKHTKKLLGIWRSMHNRCYKPSQKSYEHYGARGIQVDACWHGAEGFNKFFVDMGEPSEGQTLERIDNNANYSPENCKWATRAEQAKNKRNNHFITVKGKTQTLTDWAREIGCKNGAILNRINNMGMTPEQAVTTPIPKRPNSKLQEKDALYVRANYPTMTAQALAAKLGVSKKTVLNILHGKTFADVL